MRFQVQLEAEPILLPTVVKVVLAFWPRVVMAARQTTMIKASMTAYSTAVGPSSRVTKLTTASVNLRMAKTPQQGSVVISQGGLGHDDDDLTAVLSATLLK